MRGRCSATNIKSPLQAKALEPRAGSRLRRPLAGALLAVIALVGAGCDLWRPHGAEDREPNYIAGKNYALQGDTENAIRAYDRAVDANPSNAAAHSELGFLCLEKKRDFALAIFHFRKCQQLRADRKQAVDPVIEGALRQAQIQLALEFSHELTQNQTQGEVDFLKRRNLELQAEVNQLTARLGTLPPPAIVAPPASTGATNPPPAASTARPAGNNPAHAPAPARRPADAASIPAARIHVVRAGETPASIARRYGLSARQLLEANPRLDARRLRPGQTLRLPPAR